MIADLDDAEKFGTAPPRAKHAAVVAAETPLAYVAEIDVTITTLDGRETNFRTSINRAGIELSGFMAKLGARISAEAAVFVTGEE